MSVGGKRNRGGLGDVPDINRGNARLAFAYKQANVRLPLQQLLHASAPTLPVPPVPKIFIASPSLSFACRIVLLPP
jgi:hypothetical protein